MNFSCLGPVSLRPRNTTEVVTGRPRPLGKKFGIVASAAVKGLNGFWIGTLIPNGLKLMFMPGVLNGSGIKNTGARDASKNERDKFKVGKQRQVFVAHIAG